MVLLFAFSVVFWRVRIWRVCSLCIFCFWVGIRSSFSCLFYSRSLLCCCRLLLLRVVLVRTGRSQNKSIFLSSNFIVTGISTVKNFDVNLLSDQFSLLYIKITKQAFSKDN